MITLETINYYTKESCKGYEPSDCFSKNIIEGKYYDFSNSPDGPWLTLRLSEVLRASNTPFVAKGTNSLDSYYFMSEIITEDYRHFIKGLPPKKDYTEEKMNEENKNPCAETDEEYAWRINLGTVLKDTPRNTPIQFKLYGGLWTDRPVQAGNISAHDDVVFYNDAEYRIKPPPRLRVRKLSEIVAIAEQLDLIGAESDRAVVYKDAQHHYYFFVTQIIQSVGAEKTGNADFNFPDWFYEEIHEESPK